MPTLSMDVRELAPQPFVYVARRVTRDGIAGAIGEGLGEVHGAAPRLGLEFAGPPMVRYADMTEGALGLEIGMPVRTLPGESRNLERGTLPGGRALLAIHAGPYEAIPETYEAMQRWMREQGCAPRDAPWESYVTDPGAVPDSADWRTEVYWPITGDERSG